MSNIQHTHTHHCIIVSLRSFKIPLKKVFFPVEFDLNSNCPPKTSKLAEKSSKILNNRNFSKNFPLSLIHKNVSEYPVLRGNTCPGRGRSKLLGYLLCVRELLVGRLRLLVVLDDLLRYSFSCYLGCGMRVRINCGVCGLTAEFVVMRNVLYYRKRPHETNVFIIQL